MRADVDERNVEVQRRDPRSVWSFYRDLLSLRRHIDPAGWRLALSALPDRVASLARGAADLGPFQAGVFLRG
ncbi:MAG: hypothetical protein A2177_05620 [Spirochaetes bacterium RBG_13_68_11]|nr:MAG: hypothetical protein A2177_05620 [Spirochaetes bacterium RBG_13_68_11]